MTLELSAPLLRSDLDIDLYWAIDCLPVLGSNYIQKDCVHEISPHLG